MEQAFHFKPAVRALQMKAMPALKGHGFSRAVKSP